MGRAHWWRGLPHKWPFLLVDALCEASSMMAHHFLLLQLKNENRCKRCMIWDSSVHAAISILGSFQTFEQWDQLSTTTPWGTSPRTRATVPISMLVLRTLARDFRSQAPETSRLDIHKYAMRRCPVSAKCGRKTVPKAVERDSAWRRPLKRA
jgi:hypothetical protein